MNQKNKLIDLLDRGEIVLVRVNGVGWQTRKKTSNGFERDSWHHAPKLLEAAALAIGEKYQPEKEASLDDLAEIAAPDLAGKLIGPGILALPGSNSARLEGTFSAKELDALRLWLENN